MSSQEQSSLLRQSDAVHLRDLNERLLISSVREQESSEAAERQRAQLSALLEALHEGVVVADGAGDIRILNPAARSILDLAPLAIASRVDHIGALDLRRLDKGLLSARDQPLSRALRGDVFIDEEIMLVRSDGEVRRIMTSGTHMAEGGRVALAILVLRDVTERRDLEDRLTLTERLAAIGTLSAGMAHEINNPLAYVLANVEHVLESLPEVVARLRALGGAEAAAIGARLGEFAEILVDAKEGSMRVHRIVHDLKRFGRVDVAESSVLALNEVLTSAIRMTENVVRHHACVRLELGDAPPVSANAGQLEQVFVNLLVNAAQAMGEGGAGGKEIVVATYTDITGRAVAEVRDSGPGIPLEIQRRLFDPFFTTKAVGQGSGLGLSICHAIVHAMGGEISVESVPGKGAIFRVVLPAANPRPSSPSMRVVSVAPPRRARVLIIDDEPAIGRAIRRTLERDHDVVVLDDARAALARIGASEAFDVIFCDLMMPGMTGIDFYEALRATSPELARRVIFLTGGAFTPKTAAFLDSTSNAILNKPAEAEAIRRLVADYVSGGEDGIALADRGVPASVS
jgi:signal transduction histidine kinase/CheY-like chemotaxis protein